MEQFRFAGAVIRQLRLEKNWSQETLCADVCAVSYLSKIEQGKAAPNESIIMDLLAKLGVRWCAEPETRQGMEQFCREQMERIFAGERLDEAEIHSFWQTHRYGAWYLDLMVLHSWCDEAHPVSREMETLLNPRQRCIAALAAHRPEEAHRFYPCALTMLYVGHEAYCSGEYTMAVEFLQMAYDAACADGLVRIMMLSQTYLANSYSDLLNRPAMERHVAIASRIAGYLGETDLLRDLEYNRAATAIEAGDYTAANLYLSSLEAPSTMELHKLAICCELLGKRQEALNAITRAEALIPEENTLQREMCCVVRFRLENPGYLKMTEYGSRLMALFERLRRELPAGYARFHLYWVKEWLTSNRQYRQAYELMLDFPK